jgi:ribosome-binding factor A
MKRRQERVAEEIHRELSVLMQRESRDPRLSGVTVTNVRVGTDLRRAVAYVTILGEPEEQAKGIESLNHAVGFFRRELAARLQLRRVPELVFEFDESVARTQRILDLLAQIEHENETE